MKKTALYLLAALALTGCKKTQATADGDAGQQSTEQAGATQTEAGKLLTPEQIAQQWAKGGAVSVKGGGEKPDIVTLVGAFNKAWPTDVTTTLLESAKDPKFTEYVNEDTGGGMTCDRGNGYVSVSAGDTDEDCMEAAVWKRKNGHRLFIINLVSTNPDNRSLPEKQALCIYDYDPKTETMTPEENAVSKFRASADDLKLMYRLPRNGTDLTIGEANEGREDVLWHFFEWNGSQFSEAIAYTEKELIKKIEGSWMCKDNDEPMLTFNIVADDTDGPQIEDCAIYGSTEYDAFVYTWDGILIISENGDSGEDRNPAIYCQFRLTKQDELTGTYYLRQNGGNETKGTITLKRGNPAW